MGLDSQGTHKRSKLKDKNGTRLGTGSLSPHASAVPSYYLSEVPSQLEGTSELSLSQLVLYL